MTLNGDGPHAAAAPVRAGEPTAGEPRPLVLVVDDVFDNRDILTRRLIRRGFDVVEAASGTEALEKIRARAFDIVLLDIMMPDLGGNDVLREVRQTMSDTDLPIIMVTAMSQSEDVAESLSLGANDYVTKPVDFVVALARINAQLDRKRLADARRAAAQVVERRAAELHHLAYYDQLTGLPNRTAFRELVSAALDDPARASSDPALLFIDLDRFKAVNDEHGHDVGDRLLRDVAARFTEVAGAAATVARLGGDEFAACLFDSSEPDFGMDLAQRIVEAAGKPFIVDGHPLEVGASCGVARASDCDHRLESMLKGADVAMYEAKLAGRGRSVLFEKRMLESQRQRNAVETSLRQRIQEYRVYYYEHL